MKYLLIPIKDLARAKQLYARVCSDPVRVRSSRGATCAFPKEWQ